MILNAFSDFVEFKNTKIGKKVNKGDETPLLKFIIVRDNRTPKPYVKVVLNKPLVDSMKETKTTTFKFLYNEKSFNVLIKFDNSSKAFSIEGRKTRANGNCEFIDKYITAVMLDLMKDKKANSLIYKGRYMKDKLSYLFTLSKINRLDVNVKETDDE